jgi:hypothetical protein
MSDETNALRDELLATLKDLDTQIEDVSRRAGEMGIDPVKFRDASGGWILAPMLAAKAQVLNGLATLAA